MTISSETRKAGPFNGNGVTTSFPFTFKAFSEADVQVIYTNTSSVETVLVLDSDYTIALNEDQNANPGGTVSYSTLITGEKLTLLGNVEYTQETDIQNQGGFYPEVIEDALDKLTMQVQQVNEKADRAVKVDASSSVLPTDYLTQASVFATNAQASASAASASETSALNSANSAAASAGEIVGFEWASSWLTGTAYLKNNLVSESGNTYIALSSHTSGTFSTDYSNGLWAIFASKGAAGAGTGDLLAANNLSEVNANTARSNLSAAKSGANSDITSLTGLTTPLSKDQGGTGLAAPGAAGNVLASDGTDWVSSERIIQGTAKAYNWNGATNNTYLDFDIPSWAKRITVMFSGISTNGSSKIQIQLGDSGGFETTGYVSVDVQAGGTNQAGGSSATSGHVCIYNQPAAYSYFGQCVFTLVDATTNSWVGNSHFVTSGLAFSLIAASGKSLSATLNSIRVTTVNGADFIDAGKVNIQYQ